MSRVASNPVELPKGVDVKLDGQQITVKGVLGSLEMAVHESVKVVEEDGFNTINLFSFKAYSAASSAAPAAPAAPAPPGDEVPF